MANYNNPFPQNYGPSRPAYNGPGQNAANVDRFGNPYLLKFAKQQSDKEGKDVDAYKCYIEIGKQLYKIEVSNANKTKTDKRTGEEKAGMWVKITKTTERKRVNF